MALWVNTKNWNILPRKLTLSSGTRTFLQFSHNNRSDNVLVQI